MNIIRMRKRTKDNKNKKRMTERIWKIEREREIEGMIDKERVNERKKEKRKRER